MLEFLALLRATDLNILYLQLCVDLPSTTGACHGNLSIDSLARLHRNTRALDDLLDDREPSSVRKVWRELRDNVERETEARTAFASTLKRSVLPPLYALRETQERTRKRIKEDLRESTIAHQEYLDNVLPRIKRAYLKKCQEVDVRSLPSF